jgi:hypothetical protein
MSTGNGTLVPVAATIEARCRETLPQLSPASGLFAVRALQQLAERKIDAYAPGSNLE